MFESIVICCKLQAVHHRRETIKKKAGYDLVLIDEGEKVRKRLKASFVPGARVQRLVQCSIGG